jgi:hypothetical protein
VCTELLPLGAVHGDSLRAVMRLARTVNDRLPLVRLAVREDANARSLSAEVHLGCVPYSSGWLPAALSAVETAVTLSARELQAALDVELAQLILSSPVGSA